MNIKERRQELGKTQMDMAAEIGVSLQAYILWERGINTPTEENMEKLMLALGEKKKCQIDNLIHTKSGEQK